MSTDDFFWVQRGDSWIGSDGRTYRLVTQPPPGYRPGPPDWPSQDVVAWVLATAPLDGTGLVMPEELPQPSPAVPAILAPVPAQSVDVVSGGSTSATSRAGKLWQASKRTAAAGAAKATDPEVRRRTSEALTAATAKVQPGVAKAGRAGATAATKTKQAAVVATSATSNAVSAGATRAAAAAGDVVSVSRGTTLALAEDPGAFSKAGGRSPKKAWMLWLVLGLVGAHRFYAKSVRSGLLRFAVFAVAVAISVGIVVYGYSRVASTREQLAQIQDLGDVILVGYLTTKLQTIPQMVSIGVTVCAVVVLFLWLLDSAFLSKWLHKRNKKALLALGRLPAADSTVDSEGTQAEPVGLAPASPASSPAGAAGS